MLMTTDENDFDADAETSDLLATPGILEEIRQAEADVDAALGIDADQLRREVAARLSAELG
jgi:hypothetical protein